MHYIDADKALCSKNWKKLHCVRLKLTLFDIFLDGREGPKVWNSICIIIIKKNQKAFGVNIATGTATHIFHSSSTVQKAEISQELRFGQKYATEKLYPCD